MGEIISRRMFDTLGKFFPDVCTIQETPNPETQDAAGQPVEDWQDLKDHEMLECRVMPSGGNEKRSTNQIVASSTHVILLAGYYPLITARMRAVVDDQVYEILLPEKDGLHAITRLVCEIVRGPYEPGN
jgi:SPP1 family predicted phage head-tail adaptor